MWIDYVVYFIILIGFVMCILSLTVENAQSKKLLLLLLLLLLLSSLILLDSSIMFTLVPDPIQDLGL